MNKEYLRGVIDLVIANHTANNGAIAPELGFGYDISEKHNHDGPFAELIGYKVTCVYVVAQKESGGWDTERTIEDITTKDSFSVSLTDKLIRIQGLVEDCLDRVKSVRLEA